MNLKKIINFKLKAFSLIELTISLLVISIILAALIPMMTNRASNKIVAVNANKVSSQCSEFSADCKLCYFKKECIVCNKTCSTETYKNTSRCACTLCKEEYDENCTSCNENKCDRCSLGYYISSNGKSCVKCPLGSFCDGTKIENCPEGTYSNEGQSICNSCEAGKISQKKASKCNVCANGTYANETHTLCIACEAGHKCVSGIKTACSSIATNAYQSYGGQSVCNSCANGYYVNYQRTACTLCEAGNYCTNGNKTSCSSVSSIAYQGYQGQTSCASCPSGYFTNQERTTCNICPAGSICNGTTVQSTCPVGYFSTVGASSCSACSSKFANCNRCNANTCEECKNGYSLTAGGSACRVTCPGTKFTYGGRDYCFYMRIGLCETVNGVPWTYPDVNTLSIIWLRYMIPNGQAHQTLWSCGKKASSNSAYYYSCPINLNCTNAGTGAISSHCASTICVLNSY